MEETVNNFLDQTFWESTVRVALLPPNSAVLEEEIGYVPELEKGEVVFQTSGTSGNARLVCHTRAGLLASARAVNEHLDASSDDVWLCALPIFHVGGFGICARAYCSGSTVYKMGSKWSVAGFLTDVDLQRATLTSLVPAQVFDLVEAEAKCPSFLRAVLVGGGSLDSELESKARALGWPVFRTYGLTEAGSQVATQQGEELVLLPHIEAVMGTGGRLKIRGASVAKTCLVESADGRLEQQRCLDDEGWFQTDDVVAIKGRALQFMRRDSSRVKILGELVDVEAVEAAVLGSAPSAMYALAAIPHPRTGHALILACGPSGSREVGDAMIVAYNASAPGIERVSRCVEIGEIPRTELGKTIRSEVVLALLETEK